MAAIMRMVGLGTVSTKKVVENIENLLDSLEALKDDPESEETTAKRDKVQKELIVELEKMRVILYGKDGKSPDSARCTRLGQRLVEKGTVKRLIRRIELLDFEVRKLVENIFSALTQGDYGQFMSKWLQNPANRDIFASLLQCYTKKPEIALVCGGMLRECLKSDAIVKILLTKDNLSLFFNDYLHRRTFTVSSDAFSTFKMLIDNDLIARYLDDDDQYTDFFHMFHKKLILRFNEYVTVRESLKLLGEMLLKRSNYNVMMKYIADVKNLKDIMTVMAFKANVIKFEAFHVFKVFVANPKKSVLVHRLLYANRVRLVQYLEKYHSDVKEDPQFGQEQELLITTLRRLKPLEAPTPPAAPAAAAPAAASVSSTPGAEAEAEAEAAAAGALPPAAPTAVKEA